jgi:hypothetical protein
MKNLIEKYQLKIDACDIIIEANTDSSDKTRIAKSYRNLYTQFIKDIKECDLVKDSVAKKYVDLREKCELIVYGDPDGETDQTEMLAEIVCQEFEIM